MGSDAAADEALQCREECEHLEDVHHILVQLVSHIDPRQRRLVSKKCDLISQDFRVARLNEHGRETLEIAE
jgi:hypothetical protein